MGSGKYRSPSRVRTINRCWQFPLIRAGQIDLPDACFTTSFRGAKELDDAAIWRPAWGLVLPAICQQALPRTVRAHGADPEITGNAGDRQSGHRAGSIRVWRNGPNQS